MIELNHIKYERAVLVGLITQQQNETKLVEYLDELEFLAETAGAETIGRFSQRMEQANSRTFVGEGKLEEIRNFVKQNDADVVIFDDELSGAQLRNIEKVCECKILDRTSLILDIFAQRAKTSYAKTQVELAQYQYFLPRLTRLWTHLERQRGGIGLRGPGETEIETDRRIVRDRIALLKLKLADIDKQMATQRKNRGKTTRVALIGYTNVGKSTLMNLISKSEVFAENKLFATVDTTVRKTVIANLPLLLTDTVGFIRKLPTQLVESFKSTLDEVREADILLHIVDISHPTWQDHISSVNKILVEISASDKPTIMVFNKIDAYNYSPLDTDDLSPKTDKNLSLEELKQTYIAKLGGKSVFISAKDKQNISELKELIYTEVSKVHIARFPYTDFLFQYFDEES